VVSSVGLINEVNRHWAQLVPGWVTVCGRVNSAFHPSGVGKSSTSLSG